MKKAVHHPITAHTPQLRQGAYDERVPGNGQRDPQGYLRTVLPRLMAAAALSAGLLGGPVAAALRPQAVQERSHEQPEGLEQAKKEAARLTAELQPGELAASGISQSPLELWLGRVYSNDRQHTELYDYPLVIGNPGQVAPRLQPGDYMGVIRRDEQGRMVVRLVPFTESDQFVMDSEVPADSILQTHAQEYREGPPIAFDTDIGGPVRNPFDGYQFIALGVDIFHPRD